MIYKNVFILAIFIVTICSCKSPINNNEFRKDGFKVTQFVPSRNDVYLHGKEKLIKRFINRLDIYPISEGFDSIQYRLWIEDSKICPKSYDSENLLIIKKYKKGPWEAILLRFGIGDMKNDSDKVVCKEIRNIEPKNWDNFILSMNRLNIDKWGGSTLFSNDQYRGGSADNFIVLETATTTQYRLITHFAPRMVTCEERECKEVRAFLNLIIYEFDLPEFKKTVDPQYSLRRNEQ
ncbi:MAG: hypothetical protein ABIN67_02810 [Ferruginibacter sp.]